MTLAEFLEKHGLSQKAAAQASGIPLATVNDLIARRRSPRVETVNKILAFVRQYEPGITYEDLFAPEVKGAA